MAQRMDIDGYGEYDASDYERANDIFDTLMAEVCGYPSGTLESSIARWREAIATLYHIGKCDGIRQAQEDNEP